MQTLTGMPRVEDMDMSPPPAFAGVSQTGPSSGGVHQNGGAAGSPSGPLPPPGLSEADVKLLLGKSQAGPDGMLFVNLERHLCFNCAIQHPMVALLEVVDPSNAAAAHHLVSRVIRSLLTGRGRTRFCLL